jgi:DNA mismatch repair protein MutL
MPSRSVSSSPERTAIRVLDDAVVDAIAAGEVIERPASAVKELVENALDAGARAVEVRYDDDDGLSISVLDDGHGIAAGELELAVRRHATSKLGRVEELTGIRTFGFRGEALASMAAVAALEIVSRTKEAQAASGIRLLGGRVIESFVAGSRVGTRVALSDVFGDVPARKKFLKAPGAEFAAASDTVRRFALLHPAAHFRLVRNGASVIDLPPVQDVVARIRQVFDPDVAAAMHTLEARHGGMGLTGAVSAAGESFGSARRMFLFVNGRWVQDRVLFRAVMEGYRTYLLKARYPAVVLFLEVPGALLDVNVHPAKLEVRFADAEAVQRFVIEAIRETLRTKASPLGRWGLTERDVVVAETEARRRAARLAMADAPVPAQSAHRDTTAIASADEEIPGYRVALGASRSRVAEESLRTPAALPLGDGASESLRVIGQVFAGYIVCEREREVVLVDQHAAHERVLYERLLARYTAGAIDSQPLLVPATVEVGGDGAEAIERAGAELATLGWDIERFGDEEVVVRALPAICGARDVAALVERLASELARSDARTAGLALAREVLATVACHAATRVGQPLDEREARALLDEIAGVDFAAACPHGRPVARTLDRSRIERMFGR